MANDLEEKKDLVSQGLILKDQWKILRKLGGGAFGEVYEAKDITTNVKVAVKIESRKHACQLLRREVATLKRLQSANNVCQFITCGRNERFNYIVMTLLGRSLASLLKSQPSYSFSLSTTVRLAIQMLSAIETIHSAGYLHRDIKPANFAIGASPATCRMVYILDYGLSHEWRNSEGEIRQPRALVGFRGTVRYASITTHQGKEMGRVDDLWSLFYVLIEFIIGYLPWRRLKDKEQVGTIKQNYNHHNFLKSLPSQFQPFLAHLKLLTYSDVPDYEMLRQLMLQCMEERCIDMDDQYDWQLAENMPLHLSLPRKEHTNDQIKKNNSYVETMLSTLRQQLVKKPDNASPNAYLPTSKTNPAISIKKSHSKDIIDTAENSIKHLNTSNLRTTKVDGLNHATTVKFADISPNKSKVGLKSSHSSYNNCRAEGSVDSSLLDVKIAPLTFESQFVSLAEIDEEDLEEEQQKAFDGEEATNKLKSKSYHLHEAGKHGSSTDDKLELFTNLNSDITNVRRQLMLQMRHNSLILNEKIKRIRKKIPVTTKDLSVLENVVVKPNGLNFSLSVDHDFTPNYSNIIADNFIGLNNSLVSANEDVNLLFPLDFRELQLKTLPVDNRLFLKIKNQSFSNILPLSLTKKLCISSKLISKIRNKKHKVKSYSSIDANVLGKLKNIAQLFFQSNYKNIIYIISVIDWVTFKINSHINTIQLYACQNQGLYKYVCCNCDTFFYLKHIHPSYNFDHKIMSLIVNSFCILTLNYHLSNSFQCQGCCDRQTALDCPSLQDSFLDSIKDKTGNNFKNDANEVSSNNIYLHQSRSSISFIKNINSSKTYDHLMTNFGHFWLENSNDEDQCMIDANISEAFNKNKFNSEMNYTLDDSGIHGCQSLVMHDKQLPMKEETKITWHDLHNKLTPIDTLQAMNYKDGMDFKSSRTNNGLTSFKNSGIISKSVFNLNKNDDDTTTDFDHLKYTSTCNLNINDEKESTYSQLNISSNLTTSDFNLYEKKASFFNRRKTESNVASDLSHSSLDRSRIVSDTVDHCAVVLPTRPHRKLPEPPLEQSSGKALMATLARIRKLKPSFNILASSPKIKLKNRSK